MTSLAPFEFEKNNTILPVGVLPEFRLSLGGFYVVENRCFSCRNNFLSVKFSTNINECYLTSQEDLNVIGNFSLSISCHLKTNHAKTISIEQFDSQKKWIGAVKPKEVISKIDTLFRRLRFKNSSNGKKFVLRIALRGTATNRVVEVATFTTPPFEISHKSINTLVPDKASRQVNQMAGAFSWKSEPQHIKISDHQLIQTASSSEFGSTDSRDAPGQGSLGSVAHSNYTSRKHSIFSSGTIANVGFESEPESIRNSKVTNQYLENISTSALVDAKAPSPLRQNHGISFFSDELRNDGSALHSPRTFSIQQLNYKKDVDS